jgi:hypothetical protein
MAQSAIPPFCRPSQGLLGSFEVSGNILCIAVGFCRTPIIGLASPGRNPTFVHASATLASAATASMNANLLPDRVPMHEKIRHEEAHHLARLYRLA